MIFKRTDYLKSRLPYLLIVLSSITVFAHAQIPYPGKSPGKAQAVAGQGSFALENNALKLLFSDRNGKITVVSLEDKTTGGKVILNSPLFELTTDEKAVLSSASFVVKKKPEISDFAGIAGTFPGGKKIEAELEDPAGGINIHWAAILAGDANYVRQSFTFSARNETGISGISLIKIPAGIAVRRGGTVDGSPLIHENMFFSLEHPMSQISTGSSFSTVYLPRLDPMLPGKPFTVTAVWGLTPVNQLRRGFLYYVERERARPYHQMLHYNSWFDTSWGDRKLNDSVCLDRIKAWGDSFIIKRNVPLKAFLFDDGWDDNKTLWQFNAGFPEGFRNIKEAAAKYDAGIGVWISPWGGYEEAKEQRLAYGRKQSPPFETNANGFSLAGPVYNARFKEVTNNFIRNFNISMFKFDGVGAGNGASGASITYQKDIEALLKAITAMRQVKQDLYFSLTVGTWPSVYWLNYGDAIWRAGEDTGLAGTGAKRQQWITYRDAQAYKNMVKRAPLYPLNSVMYHGICIAGNGLPGKLEMDDQNIADEIWSFFGTGTSLQELYINPHKLNSRNWNCLRDAANWAKANEQVLADVHWVGGDPAEGEIYGYAAWSNEKGTLTLRNPSAAEKAITVNVRQVFEIPSDLDDNYEFYDAKSGKHEKLYSGKVFKVRLKPYEVKVMNAE